MKPLTGNTGRKVRERDHRRIQNKNRLIYFESVNPLFQARKKLISVIHLLKSWRENMQNMQEEFLFIQQNQILFNWPVDCFRNMADK